MKAQNLRMSELLTFCPEEGRIFLKGTRVLIENADAMGTLRKDLISTLGFERAKGFLIRYGWACGFNDALSIKEHFAWDDDLEWIRSGPVLHTLEGVAHVEIEILKVSRVEKSWLIKGKFNNSFEAEQHLRYFQTHDSPVCWMLIGYAGGYGSAYLGERVLYKETKCVGKGDPYCEFIGKTLEEWGDEINSELLYYEEKKINEELEAANRRIQQQHLQLQRAFEIQEQLTNQIIRGEGLHGITKILAEMINGSIFVFNNRVKVLVTHVCEEMPYLILQKKITEFLNNLISSSVRREELISSITKKAAVWVDFQIETQVYPGIFVPIIVRDEFMGFIVAVPSDKTKRDFIMGIQHSASVYALELIKQKTIVDLEQQFRGEFLESLLSGSCSDEEALKAWAFRLGHDISLTHNVMVMGVDHVVTKKNESEERILFLKDEILEIIHDFLKIYYSSVLCGQYKDKIIFLLPDEKKADRKNVNDFITRLRQRINMHITQTSAFLGIGRITNSVADYSKSYYQAVRAMEIARMFNKNEGAIFYDKLGSLALLFEVNNKKELLDFMERTLGPLMEYDKKHHTELLKTLEQYLDNKSMQETSKESALSVSGLKYRLGKIRELGYDLQSQQERFDLRLALGILKMKQMV